MELTEHELLDLAYELLVVDDETALMIKETLTDMQLKIITDYQRQIRQRWSMIDDIS